MSFLSNPFIFEPVLDNAIKIICNIVRKREHLRVFSILPTTTRGISFYFEYSLEGQGLHTRLTRFVEYSCIHYSYPLSLIFVPPERHENMKIHSQCQSMR